jgi:hypothetical protein
VERTSQAAKFLYMWVKAMVNFTKSWNETEPIREKLKKYKILLKER